MKNKILILLLLGIVCISIVIYLLEKENSRNDHLKGDNSSIISETEAEIGNVRYVSTIYSFPISSKPSFSIGDKYTYQVWKISSQSSILTDPNITVIPQPSEYTIIIYFDRIERINKGSYFHVSVTGKDASKKYLVYRAGMYENLTFPIDVDGELFYINTNNGSIFSAVGNHSECMPCQFFYSPWMLYLRDNIRWREIMQSNYKGMDVKLVLEYDVEGIEEVNRRKCFKIVMKGKNPRIRSVTDKDAKKEDVKIYYVVLKNIFWVDAEKRILIKLESYEDGLMTLKMELKE